MRKKSGEKILGKKNFQNFSAENSGEKKFEKIFSAENSEKKSTGRIRREYECFVIHIHNFKTPLLAHFDLISFNSSYISQRRLFCFASSSLISLFSSRRLIKDS